MFNIAVYYSVYKHINHKMTKFSINYMATCFGYIMTILRPTWNTVQVHKVRAQWDLISFTTMTYTYIHTYIHTIGRNIVKLAVASFTILCMYMSWL